MLMEKDGEDELPEKYNMSALKQLLSGDVTKYIDLKGKGVEDIWRNEKRHHDVNSQQKMREKKRNWNLGHGLWAYCRRSKN